jgi:hypothetical protein
MLNAVRFGTFVVGSFILSSSVARNASAADDDMPAELKVLLSKFREDIKSKTPATRATAFKTIAELGPKAKSERRAMCAAFNDIAPIVRNAAADCLKQVDEPMYKTALAIAINKDLDTVQKVRDGGKSNAPLVPILLKLANDNAQTASSPDGGDRINRARDMLTACVRSLVALDPEDAAVNQAVITMLSNPIARLRAAALDEVDDLKNKKLALRSVMAIIGGKRDAGAVRAKAVRLVPQLTDENTLAATKKTLEGFRFDDDRGVREAVEATLKALP